MQKHLVEHFCVTAKNIKGNNNKKISLLLGLSFEIHFGQLIHQ